MKSNETRVLVEAELIEDDKKMIGWLTVIDGKAYVSNHKCKNGVVHTPIKSITQWVGICTMDNIYYIGAKAGEK